MNTRRARNLLWLGLILATVGCTLPPGIQLAVDSAEAQTDNVGLQEGQIAPDFRLKDLSGEWVQLYDYRGQTVLLNFWAVWCGACRVEFPVLQAAYERNQEDGFVVLAVNVQDDVERVEEYVEEAGLTFPVLLDRRAEVATLYKARGLPTSYFIDPSGTIVKKQVGILHSSQIDRVLSGGKE